MADKYGLSSILQKFKENMDRQRELDVMLLQDISKVEWTACLKNRAVENQRMYAENGELIDRLLRILELPMDEEFAALLYEECYDMYFGSYDDCQVILPMTYRLISYYETKGDLVRLIFLYGVAFYEENEIQGRREGEKKLDESYNLKILNYKDYYPQLDEASRRRIWGAYYNIIVTGFGNMALSVDGSYQYLKDLLDFWKLPMVQELDGSNEKFVNMVKRIKLEWLIVEDGIERADEEVQRFFCDSAEEVFREEMESVESVYEANSEVYSAYLHAKMLKGEMTLDEIVDSFLEFYKEKLKICPSGEEITEEEAYFLVNTPLTLERWLNLGIDKGKSDCIMEYLKQQTKVTWYNKLANFSAPFVNGVMAEWCFKLIKYIHTQEEKEDCLFHLLVRRQLPTYLHSVMVANLSEVLCREAYKEAPHLFDELEESVKADLNDFVRKSALLHDVGKTQITDIVNTQGRRLWDREFLGIKKHPHFGAEMLEGDPHLLKYSDIVKGHHKFFDGSGGYPTEFDNTKSPYRVIIDLITICDCIDAATDHLGRNYKRAKTLDEVLAELIEGKGSRYNPELVSIIEQSRKLRKEMEYIVNEGRLDIMYQAYRERMDI